jgi:predicted nucleic acid-binding protein
LETPESIWGKVGRTASLLLRKGIQVPTTDLLIGIIAIENKVPVLQKDRHFITLEKQTPLRLVDL